MPEMSQMGSGGPHLVQARSAPHAGSCGHALVLWQRGDETPNDGSVDAQKCPRPISLRGVVINPGRPLVLPANSLGCSCAWAGRTKSSKAVAHLC